MLPLLEQTSVPDVLPSWLLVQVALSLGVVVFASAGIVPAPSARATHVAARTDFGTIPSGDRLALLVFRDD